ncbi:Uncharacterized protein QTN25_003949 [Entamoeba marina]
MEYIPFIDVAWYRMSNPKSPMVITASICGPNPVDWSIHARSLYDGFLQFQRLRRKVSKYYGYYVFEDCATPYNYHINFDNNSYETKDDFISRVSEIKGQLLNPNYPLWKIHIFTDVMGQWALVAQLSHCYADGVSAVRLLQEVAAKCTIDEPNDYSDTKFHYLDINKEIAKLAALTLKKETKSIMGRLFRLFWIPYYLIRAVFAKRDKTKALRFELSGTQKCYWGKLAEVDEVKEVGRRMNGNFNMVLLSCMARSYADVLKELGTTTDILRYYVAANLRAFEPVIQLGNKIGLLLIDLPLKVIDPKIRFAVVKKEFEQAKDSMEAYSYYLLTRLVGFMPDWFEKFAIGICETKATLNVTTVPGPKEKLVLFGHEVTDLIGFVPHFGTTGNGVSFMSCGGDVFVGFTCDENLKVNPKMMYNSFKEEYNKYKDLVSLSIVDN